MITAEQVEKVVAPTCVSLGVELYDLQVTPGVVRVTVERHSGIDLDTVAAVARSLSDALDKSADAPTLDSYELEVTTPGLERALRRPDHFARVLGRVIAVRTRPGTPGQRRVEGRLAAVDEDAIVVEAEGAPRTLAYGEIERAHAVFDWRSALGSDRNDPAAAAEPVRTIEREGVTRS